MGSSTPLLNDYKKEFFWRRFPQTVLGGTKLKLGTCAPAYVYINQICIWLLPLIYGGFLTLLVEFEIITHDTAVYIAGGMMALSVFIIQIIARVVPLKKTSSVSPEHLHNDANFLSDEDSVEFDSCCGVETTGFVVPPKKHIVNIILHALVSAPLVGITVWYLLPSTLSSLFSNTGVTVVLFIFGWLTVCVAQYSLSIGAPPETAIYRATDNYEINSLTRPFYIFICLNVHITAQYLSGLHQVNQALHIVFVLLPIFWTFGMLPPLDAFFLWLMEQVHIFLLGGSAMASDLRSIVMFLFSGALFLVVHFALSGGGYVTVIVLASAGYVLSLDLGGLGSQIVRSCRKKQPLHQEHSNRGFLWHWTWREALFHVMMTVTAGGLAAAVTYLYKEYGSSTPDINSYIGFVVIGILVLEIILVDIQKVYVLFGMVRNCFFPTSVMKLEVFRAKKRYLAGLGMLRRIVINFVGPILMLCFLSMSFDFTVADSSLVPALNILGAVRAFRWVWQNTSCSLFEVSVAQMFILLLPEDSQWLKLGLGVQLIILSIARNRLSLVLDKLYFWFTLTITFWSDKKQRRRSSPGLIALNFIFFPLVLGLICATALLAAPLLPLFTLPLFFMGYPRPLRFWPGTPGTSQSTCGDTIYYQQVAPQIAQAFHDGFATGSIGEASPGNHYLVRFQDRLVWVQVLEKGFGYCTLSIKGMELQETSCHAVEATKVDDILEETFEVSGHVCCRMNKHLLYTVSPCDVKLIKTYSDAKNQLTGVIDSPDTIKMIQSCFTQTLAWIFLDHIKKLNEHSSTCHMPEDSLSKKKPPVFASNRIARSPSITSDLSLGRPQSCGAESINSFVNSMWSDDDSLLDETYTKKNKVNLAVNADKSAVFSMSPQKLPPVKNIPLIASTKLTLQSSSTDVDNLFKEIDLGLPANNVKVSNIEPTGLGTEDEPNYNFSSVHSSRIALPIRWTKIPIDEGRLKLHAAKFSSDWFQHLLMQLRFESARGPDTHIISKEISEDKCLVDMYRNLITACYAVIYDLGLSGSESGPSHIYKVYKGNVPWSVASEWITGDKELLSLVLKAFRYAVKLSIDQALLGEVTGNNELQEYLEEYDTQWYIGTETDPEWNESIATGKSQLFSLDYDTEKKVYTSRVLTIQDTPVYISSLNPEAVHAQWANLSLELLYMTNDDEERYSIQAHGILLRNLNVQSADPPLGYPIYASEPVSVPCL